MRRTRPSLTTAILGAVLAVSTVRAQQSGPAGDELVDRSVSSNKAEEGGSAGKPIGDPIYGMSITRGARYLLRNGLDYLNYREYERALKFLRETETRSDELNDAEKLVLKKSIERAQRGLRQAVDVESPYALSDQLHYRNGFSPAKPDTRIASRTDRFKVLARQKSMVNRSNAPSPAVSDSDEQEEPIRLVSGGAASSDSNSQHLIAPQSGPTDNDNPVIRPDSDQPRRSLELPKLARLSQSQHAPGTPPSELKTIGNQIIKHSPNCSQENQLELAPVSKQDAPVGRASSANPASISLVMLPPNTTGLAQPSPVDPAFNENSNLTVVSLGTEPLSRPIAKSVLSGDPTFVAHTETEDTTATQMVKQPMSVSPISAASSHSPPLAKEKADALPPTQTDQSTRFEVADHPKRSLPSSAASTAVTTVTSTLPDDLPPLPADLTGAAVQPRSAEELAAPMATFATDPVTPAWAASDDLPPLPDELSDSTTRSANALASLPMSSAAQASTTASPIAAQDPSMATPSATPELSSSHSSGHREKEEETLPPLPAHDEKPTAATPSSALALPTSAQPITAGYSLAAQPRLGLAGTESIGVPSNSPALGLNRKTAQEVTAVASPAIQESHSPSWFPPVIENSVPLSSRFDSIIPSRSTPPSTLRPELKREVEMIVRKQEDELRRREQAQAQGQPAVPVRDTIISDLRAQTQLDISRAPSPAEARPIKAIPVPEDWVPLAPRAWSAQRKYWAAAATCHLPLYFQDPVLERYGHSVEQFFGPIGRYLTYSLDDPTQSTQRNQILQPFFSAGLFAFQITALPYNAIMDPPWEAQYDLGYYRPGDVIPIDTYWLPLHGYGPLLRGSNY